MGDHYTGRRTPEQAKEALLRGTEYSCRARAARKQIHDRLRSGELTLSECIGDPIIARDRVSTLLRCVPGIGRHIADDMLALFNVKEGTRVSMLGKKRALALAQEADGYSEGHAGTACRERVHTLLEGLSSGEIDICDAFDDPCLRWERVSAILSKVPGISMARARKMIMSMGLDPSVLSAMITDAAREELIDAVAIHLAHSKRKNRSRL